MGKAGWLTVSSQSLSLTSSAAGLLSILKIFVRGKWISTFACALKVEHSATTKAIIASHGKMSTNTVGTHSSLPNNSNLPNLLDLNLSLPNLKVWQRFAEMVLEVLVRYRKLSTDRLVFVLSDSTSPDCSSALVLDSLCISAADGLVAGLQFCVAMGLIRPDCFKFLESGEMICYNEAAEI